MRVGDIVRDQLVETGHATRLTDIDALADLGIRAVRYPILWEKVTRPDGSLDFAWHDERLRRLRDRGVDVVAGLLHHGTGPAGTALTDPDLAGKLAEFARAVATRYPWIRRWTPVNEPFTTARFSYLYGIWQPHRTSFDEALRVLVNEVEATASAMAAIRAVVPGAELVATEDLGKTFSTAELAYQAAHENHRRWLTFDLMTGRVDKRHPFYGWLVRAGVAPGRLEALRDGRARPDILAIDHYLTSERYLDHRVECYPGVEPGHNGRHHYVDVEAVRVPHLTRRLGPGKRLLEAWRRYRIPLVVGEVHHGCSREEQLRWLAQVWRETEDARASGADVRAVTLWALFGAVDWRSLMTRREGSYDTGAFETRGPVARPTLVAKAAATLARTGRFDHPALDAPPWWRRPARVTWTTRTLREAPLPGRPLLVTGGGGRLGHAFSTLCHHRGLRHVLTNRAALDITDAVAIEHALDQVQPWAVINTAGFVRVPEAEHEHDDCFAINTTGPELLATACHRRGIPLVTFSSDLVFDGQLGRPYVEPDPTSPATVYGRSKAEAEDRVIAIDPQALIIRTSAFFGPWDRRNFLHDTLDKLERGEEVAASDNAVVTPTYLPDLVHATLDLLLDGEHGIWHLANQGSISWHGLAREIADRTKFSARPIVDSGGPRTDNSLGTSRGQILRPLDHALDDFVRASGHRPG
ncbi:hypothetical protein GCM10022281_05460 [Sphingomonas rosea]|uniref:dTDP-4-dehydrorhamnose reductase n=1 Tax=Sphingomonas rosea TaxID=335605 RepID=A0ABP7TR52_9SPHN